MSSWLSGGLKSSLSSLKDQVANSIKDVLEELDEDETDTDLLEETGGRDANTRLLMAVDRLRDLRQILDDERKQIKKLKEQNVSLSSDKQVSRFDSPCTFFMKLYQVKLLQKFEIIVPCLHLHVELKHIS